MGQGSDLAGEDVVLEAVPFSAQWLRENIHPTSNAALRLLHAYGDSMSPTLNSGDIILVDTGRRNPSDADGIYVLETDERLFVKRVTTKLDGRKIVSNDNPSVPTAEVLDGSNIIRIIGRVVRCWNGKKL